MRKTHADCPPSIRCHKRKALPSPSPVTACYLPRSDAQNLRHHTSWKGFEARSGSMYATFTHTPPHPAQYILPVSPFVVAMCPAPPVSTQTNLPLPCSRFARLPPASTWTTLPRYGFSITRLTRPGTGNHPGRRSDSCVSHDLHFSGHVAIRRYPEDTATVCPPFRDGIVSTTERCDFRGQSIGAPPYPPVTGFHGSAPSPEKFTDKPLRAFRG